MKRYLSLTKPRIIVLLTVTGIGGFFVPNPTMDGVSILDLLVFVFIGYASAGGAMAINNYIDRDIDILMVRTKGRSSVGPDALDPKNIVIFGSTLCILGIGIGYLYFNLLTALFLSWGVLFYLFGYSLFLKRKSILNTVIGGFASPAPVWTGYAARTGTIPLEAWLLGAIVLIWTPSHTWALSTKHMDDYAAANIPMLPVKLGIEKTAIITFWAGIITLVYGTWFSYWVIGDSIILLALVIPHTLFVYGLWVFYSKPSKETANICFKLHNLWLAIIFGTIVTFLWLN